MRKKACREEIVCYHPYVSALWLIYKLAKGPFRIEKKGIVQFNWPCARARNVGYVFPDPSFVKLFFFSYIRL